jgi:hypothetical protein
MSQPYEGKYQIGYFVWYRCDGGIAAPLIAARRFPKRRWIDQPTAATGRVLEVHRLENRRMVVIHPKAERRLRGLVALVATTRLEFVCAGCGYRIRVVEPPAGCAMCRQFSWRPLER